MPLHSLASLPHGAYLGLWRLTETVDELLPLLPYPTVYQALYPAGRDPTRAAQWAAGRLLVHALLLKVTTTPATLANDANGRPYLPTLPDYAVSLSHSGEWVAGIVAPQGRVGIDVELIRGKAQKLASRFLSEAERADAGDDATKYSLYWSAKETLYKLHSRRGLVFKEQLLLDPFWLREAGELTAHLLLKNSRSQHQLMYLRPAPGYVLTYCVESLSEL
ncbi:4'-phosphopantetheinyl transferase superfamily protein [Hymenobacter aerilatus]|uniref:4'-phosphopantetheinyl transferase superfamily protein n=1 Tax=Hymenobacter aerilatus TaxID=2932251 RepID=A0A8T9SW45_9BACT|nr:4'-phosphopantetheinyl transferase family protein [Hymenobacter aerilatus]UOR05631.1 4'-phosphopantetheinyl transferase superfamily protein [Hymenobacter aerilatus]